MKNKKIFKIKIDFLIHQTIKKKLIDMATTMLLKGEPTAALPDGVEIDKDVALMSKTLSDMIEDFGGQAGDVNIPNHTNDTIYEFFQYVNLKKANPEEPPKEGEKKTALLPWQQEYLTKLKDTSMKRVFDSLLLANYLDIKPVLEDLCMFIASLIG